MVLDVIPALRILCTEDVLPKCRIEAGGLSAIDLWGITAQCTGSAVLQLCPVARVKGEVNAEF
jgi:hypothetical protein